jgi:hypothetical protein
MNYGSIVQPGSLIEGSNESDIMFPWNNDNDGNPTIESVLNHRAIRYRYDRATIESTLIKDRSMLVQE